MKWLSYDEQLSMQESAVDVVLDADTAHPYLLLSEDGKKVSHGSHRKVAPPDGTDDAHKRFSTYVSVLGSRGFLGKFYYEVQVKDKTKWNVGVARESVDREAEVPLSPDSGFWAITLRQREKGNKGSKGSKVYKVYKAADSPPVLIPVERPLQKVGVFVDCDRGLVSFCDADNMVRLYTFKNCTFREEFVYPYLCPCLNDNGTNSAPLVISPM